MRVGGQFGATALTVMSTVLGNETFDCTRFQRVLRRASYFVAIALADDSLSHSATTLASGDRFKVALAGRRRCFILASPARTYACCSAAGCANRLRECRSRSTGPPPAWGTST
jgi:hypothetical protein